MFSLYRRSNSKNRSPVSRIVGIGLVLALYGGRLWLRANPWVGNSTLREAAEIDKKVSLGSISAPGKSKEIAPGVLKTQLTYEKGKVTRTLWVYLPRNAGSKKLPVVLIAPAGTRLFHGATLGQSDQKEELPYTAQGFAVVAYSLDGNLDESGPDNSKQIVKAATEFRNAQAGVLDATDALDIALAKFPQLDTKRIFAVGHSSAATLALTLAAYEPRLKGCIAYCPCTDIVERIGQTEIDKLARYIPNYAEFLKGHSPLQIADKMKCPILLFASREDNNVPAEESEALAQKLKAAHKSVTLQIVEHGDHYASMIESGIPAGIVWLNQHRN